MWIALLCWNSWGADAEGSINNNNKNFNFCHIEMRHHRCCFRFGSKSNTTVIVWSEGRLLAAAWVHTESTKRCYFTLTQTGAEMHPCENISAWAKHSCAFRLSTPGETIYTTYKPKGLVVLNGDPGQKLNSIEMNVEFSISWNYKLSKTKLHKW